MTLSIKELLGVHNSQLTEHGHPDILGDTFLLRFNPVYRNIKLYALGIGCKYAEAWPQYLLLPFHQLNEIVASKTIPYVPSGRMLQDVESKRPGLFTTDELRMPESYHLHEAAHVIAEHLFAGVQLNSVQEKILKTIICESFANTVDALACVSATTDIHRFFLEQNCYMHPDIDNMNVMSRLIEGLGPRCTSILTLMAYVHANFLRETLSAEVIQELAVRYAPGRKLSEELLNDGETLGQIGEKLDPQFRVQTTEMYLKLEGYDGEIFELLDFPFMEVLNGNGHMRNVMEALADIVFSPSQ